MVKWTVEGNRKSYKTLKELLAKNQDFEKNRILDAYKGPVLVYKDGNGYGYLDKISYGKYIWQPRADEYYLVHKDGTLAKTRPVKKPTSPKYTIEVITDYGASPRTVCGSIQHIREVAYSLAMLHGYGTIVNIFDTDGKQLGRIKYTKFGWVYTESRTHKSSLLTIEGKLYDVDWTTL